jgi:hypothetical protein
VTDGKSCAYGYALMVTGVSITILSVPRAVHLLVYTVDEDMSQPTISAYHTPVSSWICQNYCCRIR